MDDLASFLFRGQAAQRAVNEIIQRSKGGFRIKILARRNLQMTGSELAEQSVRAALGLHKLSAQEYWSCVVLQVSDKDFKEAKKRLATRMPESDLSQPFYLVRDPYYTGSRYTGSRLGGETCIAFYEV